MTEKENHAFKDKKSTLDDHLAAIKYAPFTPSLDNVELVREFGTEALADISFSNLRSDKFEQICYHLVREKWGVYACGMSNSGQTQLGLDIYALENRDGTAYTTAIECKNHKEFTAPKLESAIERFLEKSPGGLFDKFIIATGGNLKSSQSDTFDTTSRFLQIGQRILNEYGIEFAIWTKEDIRAELIHCPVIARAVLNQRDADTLQLAHDEQEKRKREADRKRIYEEAERKAINDEQQKRYAAINTNINVSTEVKASEPEIHTYENRYIWKNNLISLDVFIPCSSGSVDPQHGSAGISILAKGHENAFFTLDHNDILKRFWPGIGTDPKASERSFTLGVLEPNTRTYVLSLNSARIFVHEEIMNSLCSAVDAVMPKYLEGLRSIERDWNAEGFNFNDTRDNKVNICTVYSETWEALIKFANAHDVAAGNTDWHMFDAAPGFIKPYNNEPTKNYNCGYHSFFSARSQSDSYGFNSINVDVYWAPPPDGLSLKMGPKDYWDCNTAYTWFAKELIPAVRKWYWSRLTWLERLKLSIKGYTPDNLFQHITSHDYREGKELALSSLHDIDEILELSYRLQSLYASMSINGKDPFTIPSERYKALLKVVELFVRSGSLSRFDYIISKLQLDMPESAIDKNDIADAICSSRTTYQEPTVNLFQIELTFRAMCEALDNGRPILKHSDQHRCTETLQYFIERAQEYQLVSRHLAREQ